MQIRCAKLRLITVQRSLGWIAPDPLSSLTWLLVVNASVGLEALEIFSDLRAVNESACSSCDLTRPLLVHSPSGSECSLAQTDLSLKQICWHSRPTTSHHHIKVGAVYALYGSLYGASKLGSQKRQLSFVTSVWILYEDNVGLHSLLLKAF